VEGICSVCKQEKNVHHRNSGKPICYSCYSLARHRDPSTHEECSQCGKVKPVSTRTGSGKPICYSCYGLARDRDPSTHEECSQCGKVKPVSTRTGSGKPICYSCYHRSNVGKCAECKEKKIIQALGLCYACYQKQRRANMAISRSYIFPGRRKETQKVVEKPIPNVPSSQPEEGTCQHYWIIETPNDHPTSMGQCKWCGETREFKNYILEISEEKL